MKALLLCSGGLDSTTLAFWPMERNVDFTPLFFDYGQHCAEQEWATLRRVLPDAAMSKFEWIDVSAVFRGSRSPLIREPDLWHEDVKDAELCIPYRTLLFCSIAAAIAQTRGLEGVYIAFISSNHAKELDCTASSLNQLDALAENVGPVRFNLPFRSWSKTHVVAEALRLGVAIGHTFSCQLFSDKPCGACPNCVERLNALETNQG